MRHHSDVVSAKSAKILIGTFVGLVLLAAASCLLAVYLVRRARRLEKDHTLVISYEPLSGDDDDDTSPDWKALTKPNMLVDSADDVASASTSSEDVARADGNRSKRKSKGQSRGKAGGLMERDESSDTAADETPAERELAASLRERRAPEGNVLVLASVCPSCAKRNDGDSAFCKGCGADLDSGKRTKFQVMDSRLMTPYDRYGAALPKHWRMGTDAKGKHFYYNKRTHERSSFRPKA